MEDFLKDIFYSNINTSVSTHETVDGAAEACKNEFSAILDYHAPVKTIQIRKKYCPYLSENTKASILERKVLQEEAAEKGDTVLLEELKLKRKEVKKSVIEDQKLGKKRDLGDNPSSNQTWKAARNILGITKNMSPTTVKAEDGSLVTSPSKLASMFNDFFLDKVKKLRTQTNSPPKVDPVIRLQQWLKKQGKPLPPFSLKVINRQQLRKLIKRMKGGKSCGVDGIDSYSLKLAAPLLEDALEHLINLSIKTGTFSTFWKHQMVFPQHKKSDKTITKNYRPVSHLVELGKLVEYVVYDQVMEHFQANNLFHSNHHGGLPHHSTATALIQLQDMFLKAAGEKKLTAALLLDQSAAYDLLDHLIMLGKLEAYNFDIRSIEWFRSYLSGRTQSVQIESRRSTEVDLSDHAAPQGSILGGLLFIINENDFPACRLEGESVLFVDDDTDCVSCADPHTLQQKIQVEADLSCDWLQDNRMVVAGDKSKLVVIGTKELRGKKLGDRKLVISVDGKNVEETESEKLLGVILNNHMTWKEHLYGEKWRTPVSENSPGLIPQLSQRVGILRKLSGFASKKNLRMLSSGMFGSKLSYCLPLFVNTWSLDWYKDSGTRFTSFTKEDCRKLQVLQNQVLRMQIPRTKTRSNVSTQELLNYHEDLSVHQLGALSTISMVKKITLSKKPSYLSSRLKKGENPATRCGSVIQLEDFKLGIQREGFVYRGGKLYNQLPLELREEQNIKQFKKKAKIWVRDNVTIKP